VCFLCLHSSKLAELFRSKFTSEYCSKCFWVLKKGPTAIREDNTSCKNDTCFSFFFFKFREI
jgi:hypothetical protein